MKGMGTDDDTLVRVVVSRCEIDMVQIKEEFQKMTGQTLEQYIAVSLPIILVWYMYDTNKILEGLYMYVEYCYPDRFILASFRCSFSFQYIVYFDWQDDISGDYRNVILALVVGGPPPNTAAKCKSILSRIPPPNVN